MKLRGSQHKKDMFQFEIERGGFKLGGEFKL